jgi:hypothetical protein
MLPCRKQTHRRAKWIQLSHSGWIPYKLVVDQSAFPRHLNQVTLVKLLAVDNARPVIPTFVLPAAQSLIRHCPKLDRSRRPAFHQILDRLEAMKFKLTANVNSSKLSEFIKTIKDCEEANDALTSIAH